MIVVGLTGGIGAGKSTVARMLAARGAVVIDADQVTRELQQRGTPVFDAIVERFGADIALNDVGELDRAAIAALVFADPDALADLNAIVHPAVWDEMVRRVAAAKAAGAEVVVLDVPLLAETATPTQVSHVITVEAGSDVRVARLVAERGMSEHDARNRIAAQALSEERQAIADIVIGNEGDLDALERKVDDVWRRLQG